MSTVPSAAAPPGRPPARRHAQQAGESGGRPRRSWSTGAPSAARVAAAAGAGLLTSLAFPGTGAWWAASLAVAVLVVVLHGRRVTAGAGFGLVYGVAFMLPHLSWAGAYVGWFPLVALVALQSSFFAVLGAVVPWALRLPLAARVVGFTGLWVAVEAARARFPFGGFGWGRLAFSQAEAPTLGLAAVGGAPLVSASVALAGCLLAEAVLTVVMPRRRPVAAAACLAAAVVTTVVGALVPTPTGAQDGTLRVAGVQGNVPRPGLDFNAERRAVLDNHATATHDLAARVEKGSTPAPDLVVWPENASDLDPFRNQDAADVIDRATDDVGAPVLVGTILRDDADAVRNTTVVWEPGTGPGDQYVKRHPVPFAEYVPFRDFFRRISTQVDLVRADMVAGDEVGVLDVAGTRLGDLICFEVVDDGLVADTVEAGAELIVVQTNNATFGYTDESVQQLAMSRLRAVEHGRAVAHVSTVGVSAMLAPDGSILDSSGLFTRDVLEADLPLRSGRTLATRLGEAPELLLAAAGILAAALGARRQGAERRSRGGRRGSAA